MILSNAGDYVPSDSCNGRQRIVVTDSVSIIHILSHNFPCIFHALPCYRGQECGGLGEFRSIIPTYMCTKGQKESIDVKIVIVGYAKGNFKITGSTTLWVVDVF